MLVKHNKISIYGILAMEHEHESTTSTSTAASDEFENTHNYCTKENCIYNPKEENTTPTENASKCLANYCVGCGVNMGDCNPRQYCYKTYCPFEENNHTN